MRKVADVSANYLHGIIWLRPARHTWTVIRIVIASRFARTIILSHVRFSNGGSNIILGGGKWAGVRRLELRNFLMVY